MLPSKREFVFLLHRTTDNRWLDTDWLLVQFGKQRKNARARYHKFIVQGIGEPSPLESTRHQLLLGDDNFVEQFHGFKTGDQLREISKSQKRALVMSLGEYEAEYETRNESMARAYYSGAYTMREIADYFGVHYMTVSRAVRLIESVDR